jgi:hypothetical protein
MGEELVGGSHDFEANRHLAKRAGEVLAAEAAEPGSQEPDAVEWAKQHALGIAEGLRASQVRGKELTAREEQDGYDQAFDGIVGADSKEEMNGDNHDNN